MNKFITQFKLELKLLFKQKIILSIPLLLAIYMCIYLLSSKTNINFSTNIYFSTYTFQYIFHTLSLCIAFILGILIVRRDTLEKTYGWIGAYPTSSFIVFTAKFLAIFLYLSIFSVIINGTYFLLALIKGTPIDLAFRNMVFYIYNYEFSYAYTLSLAILLALVIKHRVVYLIGIVLWISSTFFLDNIALQEQKWYFLKVLHLNGFIEESILDNEIWSSLMHSELWKSRLIILSLILTLLCISMFIYSLQRNSKTKSKFIVALSILLTLTIVSSIPYAKLWRERYENRALIFKNAPLNYEKIDKKLFKINSYDLTITKEENNNLQIVSEVEIPTEEIEELNSITFTLNNAFKISNIYIDNKEITFEQRGNFVSFDTKLFNKDLEFQNLVFNYEGQILDWGHNFRYENYFAFVKDNNVFLPSYFGWYPLPGEQDLYKIDEHPIDKFSGIASRKEYTLKETAAFNIILNGFKNDIFTTAGTTIRKGNIQDIKVKSKTGITLIGGQLEEYVSKNNLVSFVCSPSNGKYAVDFVEQISQMIEYYNSWTNKTLDTPIKIFYLPLYHLGDFGYQDIYLQEDSFLMTEFKTQLLTDENTLTQLITSYLFNDEVSNIIVSEDIEEKITMEIRNAFLYLYARESIGSSKITEYYEEYFEAWNNYYEENMDESVDEKVKIREMIVKALDEGKGKQVKNVLLKFQNRISGVQEEKSIENSSNIYRLPPTFYDEWMHEWEKVMKDE